jgi:hypothetical protein
MTRTFASPFWRTAQLAAAAILIASSITSSAWAQGAPKAPAGKPAIGAGEIVSFAGGKMVVKLKDGSTVNLNVPETAGATGLKEIPFSELKKDDFIATAAIKQADGTLVAREVRIFAPDARGRVPEMHGPYPGEGGANSTMTNAIVDTIVSTDPAKRTFKVTGKGGEHTVVIPQNVPLMRSVPGNRDMLKPGAHITFFANETENGLTAVRFGVGVDGLKPPV